MAQGPCFKIEPVGMPRRWILYAGLALLLVVSPAAYAVGNDLVRATPAESLVVYYKDGPPRPGEGGPEPSSLPMAWFLLDQAREFGLLNRLDERTRTQVDVWTALPMIFEHPHAFMLLDVRAVAADADSHRLGGLWAALVMQTHGSHARIEQRIQHLLNAYTNTRDSTLTTRTVSDAVVHVLEDSRFPDWMEVSWGALGDDYIVTVGKGAMQSVVETIRGVQPSLETDPWFRPAWDDLRGPDASFAAHVRFDRLRGGTDPAFIGKVDRAIGAIGASDVERGLWTVRSRDRAIEARGIIRRQGRDEIHRLASAAGHPEFVSAVVPPEATWYAALDVEPVRLLDAVSDAYLAARSPEKREKITGFWKGLQERSGVSIENDILRHLHAPWLAHGYPPHALGLPLAWTRVIRIEGDPEAFRQRLDRLLETAAAMLSPDGLMTLRHDPDGLWCLNFGLDGPSLTVTDRVLVISFSPDAVRKNVVFLRSHVGPDRPTP